MKKLINDPRDLVRELLEGTVDLAPGLALLEDENVVVRAGLPAPEHRKVAVISGGGSGHEPAHAGYVGARHADRGGRGRRLHLALGRCGARGDPCGRRSGRGAAGGQELHRRPAELRPRGRARAATGHSGRARGRRRRRGAAQSGRARPPPRHRRHRAGPQARRRRGGSRGGRSPKSPPSRGAPPPISARWASASAPASFRRRACPASSSAPARSSSASASTAKKASSAPPS